MIFVTGGTGFLGRHLIPRLCKEGHTVRVLTRDIDAHPWLAQYPNTRAVAGDLRDDEPLHEALAGCHTVIHAGGLFRFWGEEEEFDRTNVHGTRKVLEAAVAAGVQKFVHVSSIAVIGSPDPATIIDETTPPDPVEPYQASKLRGENLALQYLTNHDLPVIVLRPGAYYGPLGEYAFNRLFFRDPMIGITMLIDGGRYIIFPAYIEDVVQGIMLGLTKAKTGEIYNICGDYISHRDAFRIVREEANIFFPPLLIPGWLGLNTSRILSFLGRLVGREPFWPVNMRSYVYNNWRVSNDKARQQLGFQPIDFREGARRTVAWYRAGKPDILPELDCTSDER